MGFSAGDVNLYRYVAGNPMTGVDPGGWSHGLRTAAEALRVP